MRIHRLALVVTCCVFPVGCSSQSVAPPASASMATQAAVPSPAAEPAASAATKSPAKSPKRVATSEIRSTIPVSPPSDSFDVNSLNPVKMDPNAAAGAGFNPFAK